MKVLFITEEYPPYIRGGAGIYAHQITKQLAKYCDLTVATTNRRFSLGEAVKFDNNIKIARIPFMNFPILRFPSLGFSFWKCFKNKLDDFDLIHSNSGLLFMIKHEIPKIETVHNTTMELMENEKDNSLRSRMDVSFYYRFRDFLQRKSFSNTNYFIVPSQYEKSSVSNYYQIGEEKISVIPNGVDFDIFKPRDKLLIRRRLGIPLDKRILLFVGRLVTVKRVDLLIESMKFLDDNVILMICGTGPKYPELLVMKRKLGLNNVVFMGAIGHNIIPLYYNAADLYVHSSKMESFAITLLESMASGTPIMAPNITGMKDITQNGKIGYVLPDNPRDIADLIKHILYDYKNIKEEGGRELQYAKENYSWEKIGRSTFDIYMKLLKSN